MREPERDSLTFRRWPTGITGIPRLREWDAVVLVELPELEASALREFELVAPADGEVELDAAEAVPRRAADHVAAALDAQVPRPYGVLVVRRDRRRWSAGARMLRGETISFRAGLPASSLAVVRPPGEDVQALADGEPIDPALAPLLAEAVEELDRRGLERFESFAARADRVAGGRWQLTIDPL